MSIVSSAKKTIDWEQADDITGTHLGLAEELLLKLLESLVQAQALFQNAYNQQNWQALQEQAHKLHGACCYCGVPALKQAVQALERATKNNPNIMKVKPKLNLFNSSVATLFTEAAQDPRLTLFKTSQNNKS